MVIPESQLQIWANPGSQAEFRDAHESIRKVLETYNWPNGKPKYEIYLQGSYKNSTTIRSNSDVDIVVQLNAFYSQGLDNLSYNDKQILLKFLPKSPYQLEHFRYDVIKALKNTKSFTVSDGNKCINVKTPYLDTDVVVCMQHRLYLRRSAARDHHYCNRNYYKKDSHNYYYIEGIKFKSNDGRWIINYPKHHDKNGTSKSQQTNGKFNSTIRIFKNIKSHLVDKNIIKIDEVPSYFIECLLYNIPNSEFESNYQKTVYNILSYLSSKDIKVFKCQNCQINLFGNSPDQWSVSNAKNFIDKTINLWNNW